MKVYLVLYPATGLFICCEMLHSNSKACRIACATYIFNTCQIEFF